MNIAKFWKLLNNKENPLYLIWMICFSLFRKIILSDRPQGFTTSLLPMYQALRGTNLVTVSTQKLQDVLGDYNKNMVVLPNFFDDNIWQLNRPK